MRVTFAIVVVLAAGAGIATPASSTATCQRTVSISPQVSAGEGAGRLSFAVYSGGCAAAAEVSYEAIAGTAQPGADFVLPLGRLRWAAGDTAAVRIAATILPDTLREADIEEFTVRLVDAGPNTSIGGSLARGRILDDEGPSPLWDVDDSFCPYLLPSQWCSCDTADGVGWKPMCIVNNFNLSAPLPAPAKFRWSTIDGTAIAGIDYVPVIDRVQTVATGARSASLPVQLLPRPAGTPSRHFYVHVTSVSAGIGVDTVALYTVTGF